MLRKIFLFSILLSSLILTQASAGQRIISLSPAATEILFALGLNEEIIGDTIYCDYPAQAKQVTKVGTFSDPNIEQIISLEPDLVITTGLEQAPVTKRFKELGINVSVSDPKDISGLFYSIAEIGRLTGRVKEAAALIEKMRKEIAEVSEKSKSAAASLKKPKVFLEIWHDPIMTAGPGSIVDELLEIAGGLNIAYDAPRAYSRFSAEAVIQRNPDVIILCYMTKENAAGFISKRMGWQDIAAVRNKRIITDINPDLLLRPGPRITEGIRQLHAKLYSE